MRQLTLFFFLYCITFPAHAKVDSALATETNLKLSAEFQAIHAEALLRTMDLALLGAADVLERSQNLDELIIHEALGRYVSRAPGLRAIIATDAEGKLKYDSYTYPARNVNLKDREYIRKAQELNQRKIFIGSPVDGRTSGVSFLPMSQPLFGLNKEIIGVVAGIITPDKLIRQNILCKQCFVGIYKNDGTKVTTYPSSLTYPDNFQAKRHEVGSDRIFKHTIGLLPAQSVWVRIDDYDLIIIFTKLN